MTRTVSRAQGGAGARAAGRTRSIVRGGFTAHPMDVRLHGIQLSVPTVSNSRMRARLHALGDYLANKYGLTVTGRRRRSEGSGSYLVITISGKLRLTRGVSFWEKDPGCCGAGRLKITAPQARNI
jgi:hypothetical protein